MDEVKKSLLRESALGMSGGQQPAFGDCAPRLACKTRSPFVGWSQASALIQFQPWKIEELIS